MKEIVLEENRGRTRGYTGGDTLGGERDDVGDGRRKCPGSGVGDTRFGTDRGAQEDGMSTGGVSAGSTRIDRVPV